MYFAGKIIIERIYNRPIFYNAIIIRYGKQVKVEIICELS